MLIKFNKSYKNNFIIIKRNMHKTANSVSKFFASSGKFFCSRNYARFVGSPKNIKNTVYADIHGKRIPNSALEHAHYFEGDNITAKSLGIFTTHPQPEKFETIALGRGTIEKPMSEIHQYLANSSKPYEFERKDIAIWLESETFLSQKSVEFSKHEADFLKKLAQPGEKVQSHQIANDFYTNDIDITKKLKNAWDTHKLPFKKK